MLGRFPNYLLWRRYIFWIGWEELKKLAVWIRFKKIIIHTDTYWYILMHTETYLRVYLQWYTQMYRWSAVWISFLIILHTYVSTYVCKDESEMKWNFVRPQKMKKKKKQVKSDQLQNHFTTKITPFSRTKTRTKEKWMHYSN